MYNNTIIPLTLASQRLHYARQPSINTDTSAILFHYDWRHLLLAPGTLQKQSRLAHMDRPSRYNSVLHTRLRGSDNPAQLPDYPQRLSTPRIMPYTFPES
jgi:hypothetical protein